MPHALPRAAGARTGTPGRIIIFKHDLLNAPMDVVAAYCLRA